MFLTNVSITANQATYGAGIYNGNYYGAANQLVGRNVTLSGNQGLTTGLDSEGGAVFNTDKGHIRWVNTTISRNTADFVGGVLNYSNRDTLIEFENTILAGNTDTAGAPDCGGTLTSKGYNLVRNYSGSRLRSCTWRRVDSSKPDQLGVTANLKPLTGRPAYHPLWSNSPAIDAGFNSSCPERDIAGKSRPLGRSCDIGSFEYNGATGSSNVGDTSVYLPLATQ
jgi:hypothetical protein